MGGRRLWVLVLLGAVFSMHGVQCAAADSDAGHAVVHGSPAAAAGSLSSPMLPAALAGSHAFAGAEPVAPTNLAVTGSVQPASHDTTGGFFAVCLAVLLAGAATLVALAILRRGELIPRGAGRPRPRWRVGWIRAPRPPDLFALCLLRT